MITVMRRYRRLLQIGLLVVIAAFVVTSVVVFGSGGGRERADTVATVNGETIPVERFERRYRVFYDAYARMYPDRFSPEVAEVLGLSQQVVNDLVQETVVVQRARTEGLELTDEELNTSVHAVPGFQDNGRFSLKKYEDTLRERGFTKAGFESDVRRELTRSKVESTVKNGVKVTDAEVEQAYVSRREEVRAAWALVDAGVLAATVSVSDDELQKYLEAHGNDFRQPARRRVQVVTVPFKDFTATVSPADIEKHYAENAKDFETPHQVKAAHVLVRYEVAKGKEAEDAARAKAADIIRRLKAGEDFAKLARELSADTATAKNGGDLGLVSKGEMVGEFEAALFSMKKGETSAEPVKTTFGFHVIRVADVKEATKQPLAAVTAQIRTTLAAEGAERMAKAKADELRTPLLNAKDFMAEARAKGLAPTESTISRSERRAGVPSTDPLEDATFELAVEGVSPPVKTPAGFALIKAVDETPTRVPPLAEVKDKVTAAAKRQKADSQAAERAKQLAVDARAGDFAAAAKKAGANTGETQRFSRSKPAEKLAGDVMMAALQTPLNGLTEPIKTPQGYYVVKVLERVAPDMSALAGERDKIGKELLNQKQAQLWEAWVNRARADSKIEIAQRYQGRRRG